MPAIDPRYRRIKSYIEKNLDDSELDAASIQAVFGLSRATLYRLFDEVGGITRYIRDSRLTAAYNHLQQHPSCNLTWLLYELGFASERQFQRSFRARFGVSPAQWRERCRHREDGYECVLDFA
ncbi:AraC-like DNA-binding protein [Luteibacter rhizovicinus]|uniref:AraC-like DNA-binding protein n=2 Tax=Luteibacter rhizovicinus TaxID=242606 RepID=A0A4R3YSH7_9GAMM|nr:AraC-like DNA-binding protein [Luteibacter rhizovicinus]